MYTPRMHACMHASLNILFFVVVQKVVGYHIFCNYRYLPIVLSSAIIIIIIIIRTTIIIISSIFIIILFRTVITMLLLCDTSIVCDLSLPICHYVCIHTF